MKYIKVNAVVGGTNRGYDDELSPAPQGGETTTPTYVNADHIRSFNERKPTSQGEVRTGSRIVFANGIGMPVHDTPDELAGMLMPN